MKREQLQVKKVPQKNGTYPEQSKVLFSNPGADGFTSVRQDHINNDNAISSKAFLELKEEMKIFQQEILLHLSQSFQNHSYHPLNVAPHQQSQKMNGEYANVLPLEQQSPPPWMNNQHQPLNNFRA